MSLIVANIFSKVQEVLDEVGHPGIPLSVISKAAEMQLLYAVDRVLLGNRWLRKATGIQPKFPYMVDSFEKRYILNMCIDFKRVLPTPPCPLSIHQMVDPVYFLIP